MKKFITFEGGEGSGKSTQCKLLVKSFKIIGEDFILTREPGGTYLAEKIRNFLVKKEILPETELLLIYAARHEHINNLILPNLKKKIIICDRFYHSTYCYQVIAQGVSEKKLNFLHKNFAKNVLPNLTVFIDIKPKLGVLRSLKRSKINNKFESKNISFHKKVREGFIKFSQNKSNFFKINGEKSKKKVHRDIIDYLNKKKIITKKIPYSL